MRSRTPRSALAVTGARDRDVVAVLEAQHATRLPELVPVRVGRMLASPFAFYRGSAAVMAADQAADPHSDLRVVACGDAHLSNFGMFASPERRLLFDLNDFDEGGIAPWEWDLKRLAASVHVAGRTGGLSEDACREAVVGTVEQYRRALERLTGLSTTARYYEAVDADELGRTVRRTENRRVVREAARKARRRTTEQAMARLELVGDGDARRIVEQPPLLVHVPGLTPAVIADFVARYGVTLRADVALLASQFHLVDVVRRVVGVGSVGTRCFLVALEDAGGAPLLLQVKEAQRSVLAQFGGMPDVPPAGVRFSPDHTHGERIVAAQRILQSASDPLLGWQRESPWDVGLRSDFYVRQFRDMKGSIDPELLAPDQLADYARLCASVLARGHCQSPQADAVRGYVGRSSAVAEAIAAWSTTYADQVERDVAAVGAAVAGGRLPCERGA